MKKIIVILLVIFCGNLHAQEVFNDPDIIKDLKLKKTSVYVVTLLHQSKDTCLHQIMEFNSEGELTYDWTDQMCFGYRYQSASRFAYKNGNVVQMIDLEFGDSLMQINYEYDKHNNVVLEYGTPINPGYNKYRRETENFYYDKSKYLDSAITTLKAYADTQTTRQYYNYDENCNVSSITVKNDSGVTIYKSEDKYDTANGKIKESSIETFIPEYGVEYSYFVRDDKDRLTEILTSTDAKNTYTYGKSPLPVSGYYIDKFKRESLLYIFKYEFYEE